jgi:hypothetical protein
MAWGKAARTCLTNWPRLTSGGSGVKQRWDQARAADEARRRQGVNPQQKPAQVPTTDPDSRVMPN